jgi:hypothetical protein
MTAAFHLDDVLPDRQILPHVAAGLAPSLREYEMRIQAGAELDKANVPKGQALFQAMPAIWAGQLNRRPV